MDRTFQFLRECLHDRALLRHPGQPVKLCSPHSDMHMGCFAFTKPYVTTVLLAIVTQR